MSRSWRYLLLHQHLILTLLISLSLGTLASAQSAHGSPNNGASNTAAHNGSISHPGHVQIFTVPNNNFGNGNFGYPKCCINGFLPNNPAASPSFNRPFSGPIFRNSRRRHNFNGLGVAPVYAVPYYYGPDFVNSVDDSMEENYAPGPTIFDRNGSNRGSIDYERNYDERLSRIERQMDEAENRTQRADPVPAATAPQPAPESKPTTLVYRNGHTEEVKNYAIVGDTLFDFSNDGRRRISLYDLDLRATQRVNDEHGVDFRLPVRAVNE
jgi:hypothetical protein